MSYDSRFCAFFVDTYTHAKKYRFTVVNDEDCCFSSDEEDSAEIDSTTIAGKLTHVYYILYIKLILHLVRVGY